MPLDQTLFGEEGQDGVGARLGLPPVGIGHAAQFDGGGHARWRDIGCREAFRQAQPRHRAGFIE
ncbi:hypothetical protein D3C76_1465150 [compost metagenome]